MIHSSRFGVALAPLDGWFAERFAWGRRPSRSRPDDLNTRKANNPNG